MISLTDKQLIEGMLGGTGWILFAYYYKKYATYNIVLEGFIAWILLWFLRKIGMNYYDKLNIESRTYRLF